MDVPISLVGSLDNEGKEPKLYLATDMMEYIVAVADSMTDGAIDSSQLDTEKLKGKYIDLLAMNEESAKEWQDTIKEYQESEKNENSLLRNTKSFRRIRQGYVREKKGTPLPIRLQKELQKLIKITTETSEKVKNKILSKKSKMFLPKFLLIQKKIKQIC